MEFEFLESGGEKDKGNERMEVKLSRYNMYES